MTEVIEIREEKKRPRGYVLMDVWIRKIEREIIRKNLDDEEIADLKKISRASRVDEADIRVECWQFYLWKTLFGRRKRGFAHLWNGSVKIEVGILGHKPAIEEVVPVKDGYAITKVKVPRMRGKNSYVRATIISPMESEQMWVTL